VAKRVKTSQWVPVDSNGLKWAYYKSGEQGNRAAHGYVDARDGYYETHLCPHGHKTFFTMLEAADYLYQSTLRR
jgi:hypothetical protein